jgi:hypothetical protein
MTAVPIHSAIVISKLKTLLSVLSILDPPASDPRGYYVNGDSDCDAPICNCLSE